MATIPEPAPATIAILPLIDWAISRYETEEVVSKTLNVCSASRTAVPSFTPVHSSAAELLYEDRAADILERESRIRLINWNLWTRKDILRPVCRAPPLRWPLWEISPLHPRIPVGEA